MKKILVFAVMALVTVNLFAQKWKPIYEGSTVTYDSKYKYKDVEFHLNNESIVRVDNWNGFLKDFIFHYPEISRDSITDGITRFFTEYDKVDKIIRFEPLRYFTGYYAKNQYVSFIGYIDDFKIYPRVKFMYRGFSWLFVESVKIVTDKNTYNLDVEKCFRDNDSREVEESFTFDYDQNLESIVKDIISSKETIVRFIGKDYYKDYTISEKVLSDLSAFVKCIDAIKNNPQ